MARLQLKIITENLLSGRRRSGKINEKLLGAGMRLWFSV